MTTGQTFRNTVIVLLTLLAAYTIIVSIRIIIVLLLAVIIASAIRPIVAILVRRRIPIGVAIVLIYFLILVVMTLLFVAALPPLINQVAGYMDNEGRLAYRIIVAQRWIERLLSDVMNDEITLVAHQEIRNAVSTFVAEFRGTAPSLLNDLSTTIGESVLIFVMGAYWLTSHEKAVRSVTQLFPPRYRDNAVAVVTEIELKLGSYVRGQILIAFISGMLNFLILQILNVPNATTIGLLVGITTLVPMLGGALGLILAILITIVTDPQYLAVVAIVAFGVQQLESYLIGPRVTSNSVQLDPLLVIVYTAIGFVMFGIIGALIAVPIMGTLHLIILHLIIIPYKESLNPFEIEKGLPAIRISPNEPYTAPYTDDNESTLGGK